MTLEPLPDYNVPAGSVNDRIIVGRSDTDTSAGVIQHTFIVDGKTILDNGRFAFLDDPEMRAAVGL